MLNNSCYDFINLLSSKEPVPGGGGAAALVGAIGTALGTMVGNLTVGKKTYAENEPIILELMDKSIELTDKFESLVNKDAEEFAPLAAAYKMPSATPEEKVAKEKAMQAALPAAANAPLEIARLCVEALKLMERYAHLGSRLAVSDAGTGAAFLRSAVQGAQLNVLVNLKSIKDTDLKNKMSDELDGLVREAMALADEIYDYVEKACR